MGIIIDPTKREGTNWDQITGREKETPLVLGVSDKPTFFGGKLRPDDWDDEEFIKDLYEDFLRAAQQDKIGLGSTFEGWLHNCVATLRWRKDELAKEQQFGIIDGRTEGMAKELADRAIEAITHYLELPDSARLIRV